MAGRLLDIPSDVPGKEIASAWAWPTAKSPTLTPVGSPPGSQSRSGNPGRPAPLWQGHPPGGARTRRARIRRQQVRQRVPGSLT